VYNGRYRVVLAHDSAEQRAALSEALHGSGWFHVVGEVAAGDDLVPVVEATEPDTVLVRLLLPRMNGLAALPHIREVAPLSVVTLLSVTPSEELEAIAVARGADLCLEESLPAEVLTHRLLRVMSRQEWFRCSEKSAARN
jgi:DNA-binding NarL/FixJ family response regulator